MFNAKAPDPIALHARLQPDRLACCDLATGRRWSYAAFDTAIQQCVSTLTQHYGVLPGERVAAVARNSADLLILQQATMRIGAVFVPINWRLSAIELQAILDDCSPALVVGDGVATTEQAMVDLTILRHQVAGAAVAPRLDLPSEDAPSIILYTSGTSGRPKGVVVTERAAFATAVNFGVLGRVGNDSVFLCDSPMFHVIGLIASIRPPMLQGGAVLISSGFEPGVTNKRLASAELGVTHYFCVPQMARMLREHENFLPERWQSLVALFTGGAPNPASEILWWLERGITMVDGYGMTEAGTILGMPLDREIVARKAGAAGVAAPLLSLRLVGADGTDVPAGQPGEIWISGPSITPGYWNQPEETRAAFPEDGWFRTGDIGRADEDGFITLMDRRKDMFISGGENVFPVEVENVLRLHADVADVAVIGVPDQRWGEIGSAFVVTTAGASLDPAALAEHCARHLARYKIPKEFLQIDTLPRTASGKIQKHVLRAAHPRR